MKRRGSTDKEAPPERQNFLPVPTGCPQRRQSVSRRAPQSSQECGVVVVVSLALGHCMLEPPSESITVIAGRRNNRKRPSLSCTTLVAL
jgi:hypothetical protein